MVFSQPPTVPIYVVGTGFAASIAYLLDGFWSAYREGRPFERSKHWSGFRWIYSPPYNSTTEDNAEDQKDTSMLPIYQNKDWATCPSQDMTCYFLPLTTHCQESNLTVGHEDAPFPKYYKKELKESEKAKEKFLWLEEYFLRPKQVTRHHLYQLRKDKVPQDIPSSCNALHVRRADATSEPRHPRNFYPLSRYLSRGNVTNHTTVVLLTDDQSAIEEAETLHPDYQWVYVNRTRHRGKVPTHSHIPSQNEALELLYILAELEMAMHCTKLVHGTSNMVKLISHGMQLRHGMDQVKLVSIDNDVNFHEQDPIPAEQFMKELEARLKDSSQAYIESLYSGENASS
mgnify:CR=1 FL=1